MLLFVLFFAVDNQAQTLQELTKQATEAYEKKQFDQFLVLAEKRNALRPSHPVYTYDLARAYALNARPEEAIEMLEKSVLMNNKIDFENDADLASLKPLKSYFGVVKLKKFLDVPVSGSEKIVVLAEKDLHPEGLLYLTKSKTWLATSIRKGKIVSFDSQTGKCTDWLTDDQLFSVFAIKSDAEEKYLWAATSAIPEQKGFSKADAGKAEILKIDIGSKKIIQRFTIAGNHVFGDLVVAKNGIVYISDSNKPHIYAIEKDKISDWLNLENTAFNLQGLTLNGSQDKLYVADYLKGIVEIPLAEKQKFRWLDFPELTVCKGIDGLTWHKNSLVAIHNGVTPIRVMRYYLDDSGAIINNKYIDRSRPAFDEPALGCVVDGAFYFFANNPWKSYDKDYNLNEAKFENPQLFRVKLD